MARALHMCGGSHLTLTECNDCCEELRSALTQLREDLTTCCTDAQNRLTNAESAIETINDILANLESFDVQVVDELPERGEPNTMYLVPEQGQTTKSEYLWIDGGWELIGSTDIDLSDYVEKTTYDDDMADINTELGNKQDKLTAGDNVAISSSNVISATDTTYTAGTGLSLSGTTFNHSNSITALTTESLRKVKYDAQGHITGSSAVVKKDITDLGVPADNTTYTAGTNVAISSSNVISATDTTYSAGTGLSLSGTTLNHSNSVSALTTAGLRKIKYDAQGHITGTSTVAKSDITALGIPAQDTTYTAGNGITISSANVIAAKKGFDYRVGDVIITSANTNPSGTFGGTWTLIDKEFTPFAQKYSTTDGIVFNSSYVSRSGERTCSVQRSGHSLRLRGIWRSSRALTDDSVDVWKIPQKLLGISTLTYGSEGIAASDGDNLLAYVSYSWKSDTLTMTSNDVAVMTKYDTPHLGNLWISDYTLEIALADMLDSACNKFYWKKTA